jgi:hypothetical protein
MKASIKISSSYGFDHNWTLVIETSKKAYSFYLGQDVKFCSRVLGMDTSYIVRKIGTREISEGQNGNEKLARFICKELQVNGRNASKFETWAFCAQ